VRSGGFLRFQTGAMETTLSGGLSGSNGAREEAYGTMSVYVKF
jgi:hypothetical protein